MFSHRDAKDTKKNEEKEKSFYHESHESTRIRKKKRLSHRGAESTEKKD
jgi:hypothetical protein